MKYERVLVHHAAQTRTFLQLRRNHSWKEIPHTILSHMANY